MTKRPPASRISWKVFPPSVVSSSTPPSHHRSSPLLSVETNRENTVADLGQGPRQRYSLDPIHKRYLAAPRYRIGPKRQNERRYQGLSGCQQYHSASLAVRTIAMPWRQQCAVSPWTYRLDSHRCYQTC